MKKIAFLTILIFIVGIMFSCNDSSSGDDVAVGYIDPALETPKVIATTKAYSLAGFSTTAASGTSCLAIIYTGTLSETSYAGIAVKNGNDNLKIYWDGSSYPTTGTITSCTVVFNGTTTTGVSIDVTVTISTEGTMTLYKVDFGTISPIVTGISSGDSITAVAI